MRILILWCFAGAFVLTGAWLGVCIQYLPLLEETARLWHNFGLGAMLIWGVLSPVIPDCQKPFLLAHILFLYLTPALNMAVMWATDGERSAPGVWILPFELWNVTAFLINGAGIIIIAAIVVERLSWGWRYYRQFDSEGSIW